MERMHGIAGVMASFGLLDYFDNQKKRNHKRSSSSPKLNLTLHFRDDKNKLKSSNDHNRIGAVKAASDDLILLNQKSKSRNSFELHEPKFCWMSEKRRRKCERKKESKRKKAEAAAQIIDVVDESSGKKSADDSNGTFCFNVAPRKRLRSCDDHSLEVDTLPDLPNCVSPNKNKNKDTLKRKVRKYDTETKVKTVPNCFDTVTPRLKKYSNNSDSGASDLHVEQKSLRKNYQKSDFETESDDELPNHTISNSLNNSLNLLRQYTEEDEEESSPEVIKQISRHSRNSPTKNFKDHVDDTDDDDDDELEIVSHEQETFRFIPTDLDWQSNMCKKFDLVIHKKIEQTQSDVPLAPPAHIRKTSSDGNCFFRCLSFALTGREKEHAKVRKIVTDYMKEIEPQLEKHLGHNKTVSHYLTETGMAELSVWSTDIEIFVSSALLNTDIYVYSYYSKNKWKWVKFPAKQLQPPGGISVSSKGIFLINTSRLHYDVVTSVKVALIPEDTSSAENFPKSWKQYARLCSKD